MQRFTAFVSRCRTEDTEKIKLIDSADFGREDCYDELQLSYDLPSSTSSVDSRGKPKISTWDAGWNVSNAIQVNYNTISNMSIPLFTVSGRVPKETPIKNTGLTLNNSD